MKLNVRLKLRKPAKMCKKQTSHEKLDAKIPTVYNSNIWLTPSVCCSSKKNIFYPWHIFSVWIVGNAEIYNILHRPCVVMLVCAQVTKTAARQQTWWDILSVLVRMFIIHPLQTVKTTKIGLFPSVGHTTEVIKSPDMREPEINLDS